MRRAVVDALGRGDRARPAAGRTDLEPAARANSPRRRGRLAPRALADGGPRRAAGGSARDGADRDRRQSPTVPPDGAADGIGLTRPLEPLGQFRDTFIIAMDDEGIVIIDQHVAHERVLFERISSG